MAGKHRKEKTVRKPTKHQVTRWEKEKKLSRIITIVTACIIAAVVGIIGYWVYAEQILPYQQTAIKVNDKSYDMDYYIKMLDAYTQGQTSDMVKYYVDIIATAIPQTQAVIESAQGAGITVSDEEVKKEIELLKLPDNAVSIDMMKARVITRKYNETQCLPNQPASVEQAEVQAMLLETKFMADERKQKLLLGDNFSTTAATLSIDSVTQSKKGYLGWIPKGYEDKALDTLKTSILKDVIFKLDAGAVSDAIYDENMEKPFGYWVVEVLETEPTKGSHARGILFSDKDVAEAVRLKLMNGESWEALAKQYSQHTSKDTGGDLGWVAPGVDKTQLSSIVGALEKGKISNAVMDVSVKTKGGYWLVQVLNKQDRPLPDTIKQVLSDECLSAWIKGYTDKATVENKLDQKQKDFAAAKVLKLRSQ